MKWAMRPSNGREATARAIPIGRCVPSRDLPYRMESRMTVDVVRSQGSWRGPLQREARRTYPSQRSRAFFVCLFQTYLELNLTHATAVTSSPKNGQQGPRCTRLPSSGRVGVAWSTGSSTTATGHRTIHNNCSPSRVPGGVRVTTSSFGRKIYLLTSSSTLRRPPKQVIHALRVPAPRIRSPQCTVRSIAKLIIGLLRSV